jgi:hypothetical protein
MARTVGLERWPNVMVTIVPLLGKLRLDGGEDSGRWRWSREERQFPGYPATGRFQRGERSGKLQLSSLSQKLQEL